MTMLCAHCESETSATPCDTCGDDPLVDGRYEILARLGQGAHATTYRARRLADDETIALKELLVRRAQSLKTLELFDREAATLRQLKHAAIPTYYESFTVEHGPNVGMYIAQEFIDAPSLAHVLDSGKPMTLDEVLGVAEGIAEVLVYLHQLTPPVVHRDIKPHNLIRRRDRSVCLIDFGSVADAVGTLDGGGVPTMAGTLGYMSPEQLRGQALPQSDIFALGATCVALLTGRDATKRDEHAWDLGLPESTRHLFMSMLAVQPQNRPSAVDLLATVREMRAELANRHQIAVRHKAVIDLAGTVPRPIPKDFIWSGSLGRAPAYLFGVAAISLGLSLVVFGTGILVMIGVLLVVMGPIIATSILHGVKRSDERMETFTHGTAVVGSVLGTSPTPNMLDVHWLYYEFEHDGRRQTGKSAAVITDGNRDQFHAGNDILVLVHPDGHVSYPYCDYIDRFPTLPGHLTKQTAHADVRRHKPLTSDHESQGR